MALDDLTHAKGCVVSEYWIHNSWLRGKCGICCGETPGES